jgi:hypothetical protein
MMAYVKWFVFVLVVVIVALFVSEYITGKVI